MATIFHPSYPNARYIVDGEFTPGTLTNLYHGNNEKEAERIANFWDERVNVYIFDLFNEPYEAYGTIHPPQYTGNLDNDFTQAEQYVNELINRHTNAILDSYV